MTPRTLVRAPTLPAAVSALLRAQRVLDQPGQVRHLKRAWQEELRAQGRTRPRVLSYMAYGWQNDDGTWVPIGEVPRPPTIRTPKADKAPLPTTWVKYEPIWHAVRLQTPGHNGGRRDETL